MTLVWTPTAQSTYHSILDYLAENWSLKEVTNFISEVDKVLLHIARYPEMFESSGVKKNLRRGYITRQITLYYRINPEDKKIELLLFWDNRQDPGKLYKDI